jgi:hypothetical protein
VYAGLSRETIKTGLDDDGSNPITGEYENRRKDNAIAA